MNDQEYRELQEAIQAATEGNQTVKKTRQMQEMFRERCGAIQCMELSRFSSNMMPFEG